MDKPAIKAPKPPLAGGTQIKGLPPEPQGHHVALAHPCHPSSELVTMRSIPPQPLPAPTLVPLPGFQPLVHRVWGYLASAWVTIRRAYNSTKRVREQWWYFEHSPTLGRFEFHAPQYWLGEYALNAREANSFDNKFWKLYQALYLAYARITSTTWPSLFDGPSLPVLSMVENVTANCQRGFQDCAVAGTELWVCNDWACNGPACYDDHNREISLMAALLTGGDSGVRNRNADGVMIYSNAGAGADSMDVSLHEHLIYNAYNIAEWAKARFLQYGWTSGPECWSPSVDTEPRRVGSGKIFWDLRPSKSFWPIFPPRLGGSDRAGAGGAHCPDRPYSVWPGSQADNPTLKRAWDHAWCLLESGMRFLWKMTFLAGAPDNAAPGTPNQIRDMWNFGSGLTPDQLDIWPRFNNGDSRITQHRFHMPWDDEQRSVPVDLFQLSSTRSPSLRTWFGEYSAQKFLVVYRMILCRMLRHENRWSRFPNDDLWEHFRVYDYHRDKHYDTQALSHLDGSCDLWKPFFLASDGDRAHNIIHELLHYMIHVYPPVGGVPRDHKSETFCGGKLNQCYQEWECLNLAEANQAMALSNINNYVWWLWHRWRRWGADWPPEADIGPEESWACDPIQDIDWGGHPWGPFNSVGDVDAGWTRLDEAEIQLGEPNFMPWDASPWGGS